MVWEEVNSTRGRQKNAGMAQGEPPGGVGDGGFGLPAHLTTAFLTILRGASLGYWSMQSLYEGFIQKMKAVMGSLDTGTVANAY